MWPTAENLIKVIKYTKTTEFYFSVIKKNEVMWFAEK